jgi:hypothetical protein
LDKHASKKPVGYVVLGKNLDTSTANNSKEWEILSKHTSFERAKSKLGWDMDVWMEKMGLLEAKSEPDARSDTRWLMRVRPETGEMQGWTAGIQIQVQELDGVLHEIGPASKG